MSPTCAREGCSRLLVVMEAEMREGGVRRTVRLMEEELVFTLPAVGGRKREGGNCVKL